MNRKQFLLILAVLMILGAALIAIERCRQSWLVREAKAGDPVLPGFQINDVASIHVQGAGGDFNVVHTNDVWCLRERDNYPADFHLIRDFLFRVRDLKVVQSDLVGSLSLSRLDLNPPGTGTNSAMLMEFKNERGQTLAALLVGKLHPRPQNDGEPLGLHGLYDGRYVLLPGDPHNALLVSDDLAIAAPDPGSWLDQDFFKAEDVKFVSLAAPNAADSWEISRADPTSPWILANPKPGEALNAKTASDVGEILAFPTFDDVMLKTPAHLSGLGLDKPVVVTVLTDHFAYTLKIGHPEPGGDFPMTVNVEANIPATDPDAPQLREKFAREQALAPWIYNAGRWLEKVLHDRSTMVAETRADAGTTAGQ